MSRILAIALSTFREAVRNKILYSIVFFAIVMMGIAVVMGSASLSQGTRVLLDVGLFAIALFADIIAIFLGVTMMYQELERKTIYNILSKPIPRPAYFLGKFLGMALTLAVQIAVMSGALSLTFLIRGDEIVWGQLGFAYWLIYVECLIVVAFALFFSSFSTPYVSGFLALGIWLVGRLLQELQRFLTEVPDELRGLLRGIVTVAPDLNLFTLTTQLTHHIHVSGGYVLQTTLYGLAYAGFFLTFGVLIFNRRDFI